MSDDYRELVIADLADENAILRELATDASVYREFLVAALDALHDLMLENERLRRVREWRELEAFRVEFWLKTEAL